MTYVYTTSWSPIIAVCTLANVYNNLLINQTTLLPPSGLGHFCAETDQPAEDGEMNQMTVLSKHRFQNLHNNISLKPDTGAGEGPERRRCESWRFHDQEGIALTETPVE